MHTHPSRYDYDAYKSWREQEDERQKEALRKFYKRNAAPHYSKPFREWKIARPFILAWDVCVFLFALAHELYQCSGQCFLDWWAQLPLYKRICYIGCAFMLGAFAFALGVAGLIDWLWPWQ